MRRAVVFGSGVSASNLFGLIGEQFRGRLLVVVHTERGDNLRLISARLSMQSARRTYEQADPLAGQGLMGASKRARRYRERDDDESWQPTTFRFLKPLAEYWMWLNSLTFLLAVIGVFLGVEVGGWKGGIVGLTIGGLLAILIVVGVAIYLNTGLKRKA